MTDDYRILFDSWRRERQRSDIQPLREGFYTSMAGYASKIKEQERIEEKTSVSGRLIEKERDHVERMLQDLNRLRLRKLVMAELNGIPVEPLNLTAEEKRLQVDLRRLLAAHTQGMKQVLIGREPSVGVPISIPLPQAPRPQPSPQPPRDEKGEQILKVVRFTQSLPAIMGTDMKTYGPFKVEDVASLPTQNADNLIRKGIAKLVETEP